MLRESSRIETGARLRTERPPIACTAGILNSGLQRPSAGHEVARGCPLRYHSAEPKMPPRTLFAALTVCLALAVAAACGGGGDDDELTRGQLSDPNEVPTATPWQQPPEVVILDPDNIQPLPPNEPNTGDGGEETPAPGEPGVCGESYTVVSGDTAYGIGEKCGWPADDLENFVTQLEALNPDVDVRSLSIGQVLVMPELPAADDEEQ